MSSVIIAGNTSGTITLDAPNVAGTTTLTLPTTSGTVALTASPTFTGQATIPTINLTGGQITFPATAVPSADANTLDDYEEGTFTGTFRIGATSNTTSTGVYTKIGRVVTYDINFFVSPYTKSGSGNLSVTGMPFTSKSDSIYMGQIGYFNTYNSSTNGFPYVELGGNATTLSFQRQGADNFATITESMITSSTLLIRISGTYIV